MKKVKTYGWLTVNVNYDAVQYFYKLEKWDYNGLPKYRVFILDPDMIVYETLYTGYETYLEDFVINFCENR